MGSCDGCSAWCCKKFAFKLDTADSKRSGFEDFLRFTRSATIKVKDEVAVIEIQCEHLKNDKCDDYVNRPKVCKEFLCNKIKKGDKIMKVTLQKVLMAYIAIKNVEKEKAPVKFSYGITKNKAKMQPDIDGLGASEKQVYEADKKRQEYCIEHAKKDEEGKPIVKDNGYDGVDVQSPEFKEIMKNISDLNDKHTELLKTETDIDFYMIDFKEVPDKITPADIEGLSIFIREPEEVPK